MLGTSLFDVVVIPGVVPVLVSIVNEVDVFRARFFDHTHRIFLGKILEGSECKFQICCAREKVSRGAWKVLYIMDSGFSLMQVEGVKDKEAFLEYLRKSDRIAWTQAPSECLLSLKPQILGLEARFGMRRRHFVGVVFGTKGQRSEKEMFNNAALDDNQKMFLDSLIGDEEDNSSSCTSFRGHEIIFHVTPILTRDERRQLIGNDKSFIVVMDVMSSMPASGGM
jgi:hypothetical protein